MPTVMIADFSGMLPLRDSLLLPDNNAQLANNCWLYRGQVRGFRSATPVYTTLYSDTQQVYRIPKNQANPPDFTTTGSTWLEYPDPYMATIRNPTVGDTHNRYYFFPSDQYAGHLGSNPNPLWPAISPGPMYNTLDRLQASPQLPNYILGVAAPTVPPTVAPPTTFVIAVTSADSAVGDTTLTFSGSGTGSLAGVVVGMNAVDLTTVTATANVTTAAALGDTTLIFSDTTGIVVGMTMVCTSNPAAVFPGTKVAVVTPTQVTTDTALINNVAIGDTFQFTNSNQITSGTTVTALTSTTTTLSAGVVAGGVQTGDTIQFVSALPETRAYVYTYVSDFDEESEESPATVKSGDGTSTWIITIPAPPPDYAVGRAFNPGHYRLYRTVTDSSGNATYFQVTEVPINPTGPVVITDNASDASITGNLVLSTVQFSPPPAGLQGVVMMANGIAAGFTNDRTVWFSAAFLPHTWPPIYALTVDYPIVGLTANGTSLNIATEGSPFIATGVTPDTMTIGKISANEPCISRGSIVSAGEGMYYASPNGIQLLNTGGTTPYTVEVYEKEFHYYLEPPSWASAKYGTSYAGFIKGPPLSSPDTGGYHGFVIDEVIPNATFTFLRFSTPSVPIQIINAYSDELSGQIFGLMTDKTVQQWNPPQSAPGTTSLRPWQWKTKRFRFTMPQQFKAFMVVFDIPPEVTFTLGVRNTNQAQVFDPTSQYLIARVFADDRLVVVREIQMSREVILIPGGFKAELWEFQLEGIVAMRFFKVASSVKELKAT